MIKAVFSILTRKAAMHLAPILVRAFAQLQMVSNYTSKDAQIPYRWIVERGNKTFHRSGKATHHPLLKRQPASELGVEAVRIYEAVSHILGSVATGAGVCPVRSGLPCEAPGVLVSQKKHVVAVLGRSDEVAVFAKIADVIRGSKLFPPALERYLGTKHLKLGTEMRPKYEAGYQCGCIWVTYGKQGSP